MKILIAEKRGNEKYIKVWLDEDKTEEVAKGFKTEDQEIEVSFEEVVNGKKVQKTRTETKSVEVPDIDVVPHSDYIMEFHFAVDADDDEILEEIKRQAEAKLDSLTPPAPVKLKMEGRKL